MKIRRISDFQKRFSFPDFDSQFENYRSAFLASDLGKIYQAIPWMDMVKTLGLKESSKGPCSIFSPRGKIALMFLKHYAACSDQKLMEQLNANLDFQYFCDLHIPPQARLSNFKIVSAIRCELAALLDIDKLQDKLIHHWLPFMKDLDSISCDATCYESAIRYPSDVKLLWEAVDWSYQQMVCLSKKAGVQRLRTKYKKWVIRYISYSKMKRKTKKRRKSLQRALLKLLAKINRQLRHLEGMFAPQVLSTNYRRRRATIELIEEQQSTMFEQNIRKIPNRIVSIDKPYLRPIVRGKENKPVEFGAKVHKLLIDGISFIEHLSFDAFNEGIRLKRTIFKAQRFTKKKVKVLGADGIYANNANRRFVSKHHIKTDFKPKGKQSKNHKQQKKLRRMITKERASRLEGSFGTDKEHFLLKRNLARTKKTEILMLFFGIHTANALKIGRRMTVQLEKAA